MLANGATRGQPGPAVEVMTTHWYLIHGAASNRLIWSQQLPVLKGAQRAELPALDPIEPEHLIRAWAAWCAEDMDEPSIIMGHSLGGAIAQQVALDAPDLVRGLVLVGTGPRLPVNRTLLDALATDPSAALAQLTRWSLRRNADPRLLARSLDLARSVDGHRAWREFAACNSFDVRESLSRVQCPVALIAADQDRMTPEPLLREFQRIWPNAPLYQVAEAGHMMMLEQPQAFNRILEDILRQPNFVAAADDDTSP